MSKRAPLILTLGAVALAGIGVANRDLIDTTVGPPLHAAERAVAIPAPALSSEESGSRAAAVFAGGCFWGVEAVFERLKGVQSVVSGYSGGSKATASYKQVGSGRTGHAEAVRIVYDPSVISYGELMRVFFSVAHDPTQKNRQGPDSGTEYRGAIFPVAAGQAKAASAYIAQLEKGGYFGAPIATRVEKYTGFYPAEKYHQDFMARNPRHPYILRWDVPKVRNLEAMFPNLVTPS